MKSMSIVVHGSLRWNCVCKCSSGFCRILSPPIHIFAGENVCIQAMMPAQFGAALASSISSRIDSAEVITDLNTIRTGTWLD
jgi:hypothetical protein